MILYKSTEIVVLTTIAINFMISLYYRGKPKKYIEDKTNDKFNLLAFGGLLALISMILAFASAVRFIILL